MRVDKDGSVTAVPIELGAVSDTKTQVINGEIAVGDQVVVMVAAIADGKFDPRIMRDMNQITNGGGNVGK